MVTLYNIGNATSVLFLVEDYPPGNFNLTILATDVLNRSTSVVVPVFISGMYVIVCISSSYVVQMIATIYMYSVS